MYVRNGMLREQFIEQSGSPFRLGRHLELDARSLAYTIEAEHLHLPVPVEPVDWPSPIPILDQGNLGSCTGNAGTRALAQYILKHSGVLNVQMNGYSLTGDPAADEQFAVNLYHLATVMDGFPGVYPPEDTGSSGLAICRVLKSYKLVARYTWATTLRGFAALLQRGPVIIGTPWYQAWFSPDPQGFIDSGDWAASGVAGGHEIYVRGIEAWDDRDPSKSVFTLDNSWGPGWADHGSFRMRASTYMQLRSQIDVKQLAA